MTNYELSIIVPGYRVNNWERMYESVKESAGSTTFEMIFVGPNDIQEPLKNTPDIQFQKDFGSPSRSAQIATTLSRGEYLMNSACDDGIFLEGALYRSLQVLKGAEEYDPSTIHAMNMRFKEGPDFKGETVPLPQWKAGHGEATRRPGIDPSWSLAIYILIKTEHFRHFGGWDCRYEHLNLNTHDLAFRIQKSGGRIIQSPEDVVTQDWNENDYTKSNPVWAAFEENDYPLFKREYDQPISEEEWEKRIRIPYNNWKDSPERWSRRFGTP